MIVIPASCMATVHVNGVDMKTTDTTHTDTDIHSCLGCRHLLNSPREARGAYDEYVHLVLHADELLQCSSSQSNQAQQLLLGELFWLFADAQPKLATNNCSDPWSYETNEKSFVCV